MSLRRIAFALWGLVGPTHARDDLPLTLLSRSSLRYQRVPFAVHVGPIRRGSPRPLPPRRRDATKLFPVQSAFVRQGMRCSSSALSSGDCASCAPWGSRATAFEGVDPGRPAWCCAPRLPGIDLFVAYGSLRHVLLRSEEPRSISAGRLEQRTRLGTIQYIRRPGPRPPRPPVPLSSDYVVGEGLL